MRPLLNRVYMVMLMAVGLDAAILDPLDKELMETSSASSKQRDASHPGGRALPEAVRRRGRRRGAATRADVDMNDPKQAEIWKTVQVLLNKIIYTDSYLRLCQSCRSDRGSIDRRKSMLKEAPTPTVEELLAKAKQPSADAMRLHPFYRGKIETTLKCRVRDFNDFAIWYTPGVAAPCKAIDADPELVYEYTNKWNTVAVVCDGTRVLGLGDIGPKAGLPVMEGKALLYKYLGGVDALPIMLDTKDPDKIIETVLLHPARLRRRQPGRHLPAQVLPHPRHAARKAEIPVWHDDQQGTATVTLAGLINALKVVGKKIDEVEIAFVGCGRRQRGLLPADLRLRRDPASAVMVDSKGILHKGRNDIEMRKAEFVDKWKLCQITNAEGSAGRHRRGAQGRRRRASRSPSPARTRSRRSGSAAMAQGRDRLRLRQPDPRDLAVGRQGGRRGRGRHRAAPTSPTRSTTRSASPASSAARWTCAPRRSPTRCASPRPTRWPTWPRRRA